MMTAPSDMQNRCAEPDAGRTVPGLAGRLFSRPSFWFFASFFVMSLGVISGEPTRIDVRFAMMVAEMSEHGLGLFPTMNGQPYTDYPSTWIALSYLTTFGGSAFLLKNSLWFLALPTLLCGAWCVTLAYKLADPYRAGSGMVAAALALMSWEFLNAVACFGLDIPVAALALTMVWLFQRGTVRGATLGLYFCFAVFAFAVRGPLGVILFGAVTGGFLLGSKRWLDCVLFGACGLLAASVCCWGALRLILATGGNELWETVKYCQFSSRVGDKISPVYYFTNGLGSYAPATILALPILYFLRRKLLQAPLLPWMCAILVPMVLLSIPGSKHLRYMVATVPLFAVVAGWGLFDTDSARWNRVVRGMVNALASAWLFWIPVLILLVKYAGIVWLFKSAEGEGALRALPVLFAALASGFLLWHFRPSDVRLKLVKVALCVGLLLAGGLMPLLSVLENSSLFVGRIESGMPRERTIWLYAMNPDHDDLKVLFHLEHPERVRYVYEYPLPAEHYYSRMYPGTLIVDAVKEFVPGDRIVMSARALKMFRANAANAGLTFSEFEASGKLGHGDFSVLEVSGNINLVKLLESKHITTEGETP